MGIIAYLDRLLETCGPRTERACCEEGEFCEDAPVLENASAVRLPETEADANFISYLEEQWRDKCAVHGPTVLITNQTKLKWDQTAEPYITWDCGTISELAWQDEQVSLASWLPEPGDVVMALASADEEAPAAPREPEPIADTGFVAVPNPIHSPRGCTSMGGEEGTRICVLARLQGLGFSLSSSRLN